MAYIPPISAAPSDVDLCCQGTLLNHLQVPIHQDPQDLLSGAAPHLVIPEPV